MCHVGLSSFLLDLSPINMLVVDSVVLVFRTLNAYFVVCVFGIDVLSHYPTNDKFVFVCYTVSSSLDW